MTENFSSERSDKTLDSKTLYELLSSVFAAAVEQIEAETGLKPRIVVWAAGYGDSLHFDIVERNTGLTETKVSGKDFHVLVHEFIRRATFDEQQARLKIGPPTVDG